MVVAGPLAKHSLELVQRRAATPYPLEAALPQRSHADLASRAGDHLGEGSGIDETCDRLVHRHDLQNGLAPAETAAVAVPAPPGLTNPDRPPRRRARLGRQRFNRHRLGAVLAEAADQPLRHDALENGGHLESIDAHVAKPDHGRSRVVRVQC
jgi:hypothetical protein